VASVFGVAPALVREIEYVNDEWLGFRAPEEERFNAVRRWVVRQLLPESTCTGNGQVK
jgi:hypothetical protein